MTSRWLVPSRQLRKDPLCAQSANCFRFNSVCRTLPVCSLPESTGLSWGSAYPQDDMQKVAAGICQEIAALKVLHQSH